MTKLIAIALLLFILIYIVLPILGWMFAVVVKFIIFCLAVYLCVDLYQFIRSR